MAKAFVLISAVAATLLTASSFAAPVLSRPPTVQNSPGYEARLAESRKAWAAWQAQQQAPKVIVRPSRKKKSQPPQ